jgi:hypothetical protein
MLHLGRKAEIQILSSAVAVASPTSPQDSPSTRADDAPQPSRLVDYLVAKLVAATAASLNIADDTPEASRDA